MISECKGRRLYELDCERLKQAKGMIAIMHGPSLDDGVCMEIGFLHRLGGSIVILTTDFQTYGLNANGPELMFPDALLQEVASGVVRVHELREEVKTGRETYSAFMARNTSPLRHAATAATQRLLTLMGDGSRPASEAYSAPRTAFLESSPYYNDGMWVDIAAHLIQNGWTVRFASRMQATAEDSLLQVLAKARADWDALSCSELLIVDVNGPETPVGAALLIGASRAAGRRVLAYHAHPAYTFALGREPNYRNLMIQYALDGRFQDIPQLARLLSS